MSTSLHAVAPPGQSAAARAVVELTRRCDNRCGFCAQGEADALASDRLLEDVVAELTALRGSAEAVSFVGGEPALAPSLPAAIRAARAAGFVRVGLQSNGRCLAGLLEALVADGLTDLHLSIHGASAVAHDYHTGVPGSFEAVCATLDAARALGLEVVVTTVLTRSNFRVLSALPSWLLARGVRAWLVEMPHAAGRAALAFDRLMPRLGLALPFALHALDLAARSGLPAHLRGAPTCLLGPFAARVLPSTPRAYGAACEGCVARARCPGVDAAYLARFDGDELRAPEAAPAAPVIDALADRFVGVGPLIEAQPAVALSPKMARVSLPQLGKVRPARQEVRGGERRSGEALREILPTLFEAQDD